MPQNPPAEVTVRDSAAEAAKRDEKLEDIRADLHLTESVDPLDAILAIDKAPQEVTDTFNVPIIGGKVVQWTVRALTGTEIDELDERCTTWVKRGRGEKVRERNTQRFERMLVALATITPNLDDPRIVAKFGQGDAETRVGRIMQAGTYDGLSSQILGLSGYTDDLIGTAGN